MLPLGRQALDRRETRQTSSSTLLEAFDDGLPFESVFVRSSKSAIIGKFELKPPVRSQGVVTRQLS
jgi:hypothetical protein